MIVDNANEEYGQRSTQNNVNKKTGSETGTQYVNNSYASALKSN